MNIQGKMALIKRWIGVLSRKNQVAIVQGIGKYYKKNEIAGYYNDLTGKVNKNTLLDENGIPINRIAGDKTVYFPISIMQYALGLWDLYLENSDSVRKDHFLNICEWIINNQREDGSWNCFGPIGHSCYTVSSMGQGEAISVLLRAYQLTENMKWLEAARKAVNFMIIPVNNGGTLFISDGNYYFEEYASVDDKRRSVLNGWIFTLFGLYDYLIIESDMNIRKIFTQSVDTLVRHVNDYDMGYWSFYDKTGRIASPAYHQLHIALLQVMADITGEKYLAEKAERWKDYSNKKWNKYQAIVKKAFQKLKENPEGIIIQ